MPDTEQIRQQVRSPAPFSTWFGVVLLILLFGAIAVAIIGPAPRGDTYEQQRAQNREKKLKDLRDEDAKALTSYAWIDKNKGSVRIPIERAMELAIADLAKKKPTSAGPIAAPSPEESAPAAGPAAPSPAPVASTQPTGDSHPARTSQPQKHWDRPRTRFHCYPPQAGHLCLSVRAFGHRNVLPRPGSRLNRI